MYPSCLSHTLYIPSDALIISIDTGFCPSYIFSGLWDGPIGVLGHTRGGMAEDPVLYVWSGTEVSVGRLFYRMGRPFFLREVVEQSLPSMAERQGRASFYPQFNRFHLN